MVTCTGDSKIEVIARCSKPDEMTSYACIDYLFQLNATGHSLSMLDRIAKSLNQRMVIQVKTNDPNRGTIRYVFREVLPGLRRKQGLTPGATRC